MRLRLICWCSKRQTTTARNRRNVMESELISGASASDEAVWFHGLMTSAPKIIPGAKLLVTYENDSRVMSVPILMDDVAAIQQTKHPQHPKVTQFSRRTAMREFRIQDLCLQDRIDSTDALPSLLQPLRLLC